jgi:hypothetical protein
MLEIEATTALLATKLTVSLDSGSNKSHSGRRSPNLITIFGEIEPIIIDILLHLSQIPPWEADKVQRYIS